MGPTLILKRDFKHFQLVWCATGNYLRIRQPALKNGQTHSNNSSANCRQIVWVCLTILLGWRLKSSVKRKFNTYIVDVNLNDSIFYQNTLFSNLVRPLVPDDFLKNILEEQSKALTMHGNTLDHLGKLLLSILPLFRTNLSYQSRSRTSYSNTPSWCWDWHTMLLITIWKKTKQK